MNKNKIPIITVDGPSGVGKGTLAQFLTHKTKFHLLDSGAIYRALAYGAIKNNLSMKDLPGLVALAKSLPIKFIDACIIYEGEDITTKVRNEEIAGVASTIAVVPEVRAALMNRQKDFAMLPGLIADGRDMGTVVFPKADIKLYLTASAQIRAERRVKQLKKQGVSANIDRITKDIEARDDRDLNRQASPLMPADDAIIIDTSNLDVTQVCHQVESLLVNKGLLKIE